MTRQKDGTLFMDKLDKRIHAALLKAFKPLSLSKENSLIQKGGSPSEKKNDFLAPVIELSQKKSTTPPSPHQEGMELYARVAGQKRFKKKKKGCLIDFSIQEGEGD